LRDRKNILVFFFEKYIDEKFVRHDEGNDDETNVSQISFDEKVISFFVKRLKISSQNIFSIEEYPCDDFDEEFVGKDLEIF
jgi:hypothetical protein